MQFISWFLIFFPRLQPVRMGLSLPALSSPVRTAPVGRSLWLMEGNGSVPGGISTCPNINFKFGVSGDLSAPYPVRLTSLYFIFSTQLEEVI